MGFLWLLWGSSGQSEATRSKTEKPNSCPNPTSLILGALQRGAAPYTAGQEPSSISAGGGRLAVPPRAPHFAAIPVV